MRQDGGAAGGPGGRPHRVAAYVVGGTVNPFELSCAAEVFARGDGRYRFDVVADRDGPLHSTRGFSIAAISRSLITRASSLKAVWIEAITQSSAASRSSS